MATQDAMNPAAQGYRDAGEVLPGRGLGLWLAALTFTAGFYLTTVAWFASGGRGFEYLQTDTRIGGFAYVAAAMYVAALVACTAWANSLEPDSRLRSLAERTGVAGLEYALLGVLALGYISAALVREVLFLPMLFAFTVPAVTTLGAPVARRSLRPLPEVRVPHGAHYWLEDELPEYDPTQDIPPGFSLRRFAWHFGAGVGDVRLQEFEQMFCDSVVEEAAMRGASGIPTTDLDALRRIVTAGTTREVVAVASRIRALVRDAGLGVLDEIACVVGFVSESTTLAGPAGQDVSAPQSPIVTLLRGGEPTVSGAMLCAALLDCLGHGVLLVDWEGGVGVAIGGADGINPGPFIDRDGSEFYFAGWIPGDGWRVGAIPGLLVDSIRDVLPLETPAAVPGSEASEE